MGGLIHVTRPDSSSRGPRQLGRLKSSRKRRQLAAEARNRFAEKVKKRHRFAQRNWTDRKGRRGKRYGDSMERSIARVP